MPDLRTSNDSAEGGCISTISRRRGFAPCTSQRKRLRSRSIRAACSVRRAGFTLLELLVVISIISVLVSLILPAVSSSRAVARRMVCSNNLRQVALAIQNGSTTAGRFPASGNFGLQGELYHSWVTSSLGYLDRLDLNDLYDRSMPSTSPTNKKVTDTHLNILICPDDISVVPGRGNLSYVVNAGFGWTVAVDCPANMHLLAGNVLSILPFDLNGNGVVCSLDPIADGPTTDRELLFDLSLFFIENLPIGTGTVRHHTFDTIIDGASNTLMLSENIRAGYDPVGDTTWGFPGIRNNAFLISSYICNGGNCSVGNVDYRFANDHSSAPARLEAINSSIDQPEGGAPWPSSLHTGIVNVAFCDGRVRPLSATIDGSVYAALITPRGTQVKGPLSQRILSDHDY